MKISFDINSINVINITQMVQQIAEWGYEYISLSTHSKINPLYRYPKASIDSINEYKKITKETGIKISSIGAYYRWTGPTEEERQASIRNWRRLIETSIELDTNIINTQLFGNINNAEHHEAMWYHSMEELLPIFEREGIKINIQKSNADFCEDCYELIDLIKSLRSNNIFFSYNTSYYLEYETLCAVLNYADSNLMHIILSQPFTNDYFLEKSGFQQKHITFDILCKILKTTNFKNENKNDSILTISYSNYLDEQNTLTAIQLKKKFDQIFKTSQNFLLEEFTRSHYKNLTQ